MSQSHRRKVLLIGWDAADWEMINPLLQSGQMPALAQLLNGGVRGNLVTIQPVLSPMLWTSIATGKRADKHGIFGFTEPLSDGTGIGPVRSTSRKCKAIWNILSQNGLRSNIVGWFASDPPEPIDGVMVTDRFLVTPKGSMANSVYPSALASSLAELRVAPDSLMAEDLLAFIPRLKELDLKFDDRPLKLARRLAKAASVQAIATALIQSEPWDLMAVYFDAIDQFGHEFMSYHPPRMQGITEKDFELYQHVMTGCYRFHDMMLHVLLQYIDEQTNVILVSDHGYECGHRRPSLEEAKKNPEGCHRSFGVACLKGTDVKKNERLYGATILDVTPTILTLLGLPVGGDMDGRPWVEVLREQVKVERIFSWEGVGDSAARMHTSEARQDPAEAAEAIAQLVELGYIAPPSKDTQETIRSTIRCNKISLVRALIDTPRMAQAVPLLQELISQQTDDEWCILTLARSYLSLRKLKEIRPLLETLSPKLQHSAQVQLMLAELALAEGNKPQAISHVEAASANGILHDRLFNQIGRAFLQVERWQEAGDCFRKSLETEPDNPVALDGLASIHLAEGEWENAVEKSLEAVGLVHFFPEAHFHLAVGLERCGQTREAIAAYETALGLGYWPAGLHRHLVELYRPIDAEKSNQHKLACIRLARPTIYHADFKSKLADEPPPNPQAY
jgi:predicted AlkP superfamily phosphohydrolase/phosphomutase/tetratricopeptide (TPR) repeat protein